MKQFLFFLLAFQFFIDGIAQLNQREEVFITSHRLTDEEEKCLDDVFESLSERLHRLFDGLESIDKREIAGYFPSNIRIFSYRPGESIVFWCSKFPTHVIKIGFNPLCPRKNLSRVIFADQIYHLVHDPQFGFSKVRILHKKLYHRKNCPVFPLNDFNYVVLAPFVYGQDYSTVKDFSAEHADEMLAVMHLLKSPGAKHFDIDSDSVNVFYTKEDKIAFIDTRICSDGARKWWLERAFADYREKVIISEKEKLFVEKHQVPPGVELILNDIFSFEDQRLCDVLDGKIVPSSDEVVVLLGRSGFSLLSQQDAWSRSIVVEHPKLPGYVIKIGLSLDDPRRAISRVIVANQINLVIDDTQYGITHVRKINKLLYHRPSRPVALNDFNYVVVSPKREGNLYGQASFIPQKTKKDCHTLVTRLNRSLIALDVTPENIIVDQQGKATFIDTEITKGFFRDNLLRRVLD